MTDRAHHLQSSTNSAASEGFPAASSRAARHAHAPEQGRFENLRSRGPHPLYGATILTFPKSEQEDVANGGQALKD